jgi:heme a synthase
VRSHADRSIINGALWLAGGVALQATLGILTLLNQAPIDLALAHQAVAIAVLTLAVLQAERLVDRRTRSQQLGQPATQSG